MDKILTVEEVATILRVKPITVREMFREKRLRAFKIGKAWRTTEAMLQEDVAAIAQMDISTGVANTPRISLGIADTPVEEKSAAPKAQRGRKKRVETAMPVMTAAPVKPEAPEELPGDEQQMLF